MCFRYCSTLQTVSEHINLENNDDGVSISMVKTHFVFVFCLGMIRVVTYFLKGSAVQVGGGGK